MATRTSKPKLLFKLAGPLPARVYRAAFKPLAAAAFLDVRALKKQAKVKVECGHVVLGERSVALVAELQHGVITAIAPAGCDCCKPRRGKTPPKRKDTKALLAQVTNELNQRKIDQPAWPVGTALQPATGFRIPIGPIVIVIGPDDGEGIDTFDICIVIEIDGKSCIFCLLLPSACVGMGPPF